MAPCCLQSHYSLSAHTHLCAYSCSDFVRTCLCPFCDVLGQPQGGQEAWRKSQHASKRDRDHISASEFVRPTGNDSSMRNPITKSMPCHSQTKDPDSKIPWSPQRATDTQFALDDPATVANVDNIHGGSTGPTGNSTISKFLLPPFTYQPPTKHDDGRITDRASEEILSRQPELPELSISRNDAASERSSGVPYCKLAYSKPFGPEEEPSESDRQEILSLSGTCMDNTLKTYAGREHNFELPRRKPRFRIDLAEEEMKIEEAVCIR